jgi:uncharacterized protein YodC (DUF2158 family)
MEETNIYFNPGQVV